MRQRLIEALTAAVEHVFSVLCGIEAKPGGAVTGQPTSLPVDISGIVGIEGPITGSLAFHCRKDLATLITGKLLELEVTEIDDDVKDLVGEIANMIAGNASSRLSGDGQGFQFSVPTIVTGRRLNVRPMRGDLRWISLPFQASGMSFAIDFCIEDGA